MRRLAQPRRATGAPGSAIVVVVASILVLAIIAGVISFSTSGLRRAHARAELSTLAIEIAESAIDEAAQALTIEQVFDRATFGDISTLMDRIRDGVDIPGVSADWREIRYQSGRTERLFEAFTFPFRAFTIDPATARRHHAQVVGPRDVTPVIVRPLRFRREHYTMGSRWVNWGIVQLSCVVSAGGALGKVTREVTVDRLFKLRAFMNPASSAMDWRLTVSPVNQRTIIRSGASGRGASTRGG